MDASEIYIDDFDGFDEDEDMIAPMPGNPAPWFETKAYADGEFKEIGLDDYLGKWVVLFFYPADFTFVCPTELVGIAKNYQWLKDNNVEVLAISTDSHFVHKNWNDMELSKMIEGGLPYPMLHDKGGEIGMAYNVYDAADGMNIRGTFIIDPEGDLQSMQVSTNDLGRSTKELLRQIKALQFTAANDGIVAPCDWEDGDDFLDKSDEVGLTGHMADNYKK